LPFRFKVLFKSIANCNNNIAICNIGQLENELIRMFFSPQWLRTAQENARTRYF